MSDNNDSSQAINKDVLERAKAHLESLPPHLRDRYSAQLIGDLANEIELLRLEAAHALCQDSLQKNLTEAELDALEFAVETGRVAIHDQATLRSLLERLK